MRPELVERFRSCSELGALPADDLVAVVAACSWRSYGRGQLIVGQEDRSDDAFLIADGTVRISFYASDGTEVGFRDMRRGEIFGEIAAIDGQTRSASVIALTDVRLGSLRAEAFRELLRSHPGLAEMVMRRLARLVRALSDRVVEFSTLAVSNRIHAELLRLARENMIGDHAYVDPAPGHALLASRVSTHREAVTREIKRLAADGILKKSGRALIIRDLAALETLVHRPLGSDQVGAAQPGDRPSKRAASTGRRRSDGRPVLPARS